MGVCGKDSIGGNVEEEGNEYRNGDLEYGTISLLIEDILDERQYRGYVYMESRDFDNTFATTVIRDEDSEELYDEIRYNALYNIVSDILKDKDSDDERNAAIAEIYDTIYSSIHYDDVDDEWDDDTEEDMEI